MSPDAWLPFSRWNLRYNPFGELTRSERASVAVFDPAPFVENLGSGQVAIQFIGDCGRGKTTRLLAIERQVGTNSGAIYLPPLSGLKPTWWLRTLRLQGYPLIIDEAQRIPLAIRWSLFRRRLPLVLGTHRDLTSELKWAGYCVQTVDVGPQNNAMHVVNVANARLNAARLGVGAVPVLSIRDAEVLVSRFGDDLRAIESFLYHQVQQQVGRDEQMRFVD